MIGLICMIDSTGINLTITGGFSSNGKLYKLVPDTGGPGQWRGVCGSRITKQTRAPMFLNFSAVGRRWPMKGIAGGQDGWPVHVGSYGIIGSLYPDQAVEWLADADQRFRRYPAIPVTRCGTASTASLSIWPRRLLVGRTPSCMSAISTSGLGCARACSAEPAIRTA